MPLAPEPAEALLREALHGAYELESELGAGGMGTVYLATDLRHRRRVAIKVLRPDVAAAMGRERFRREILIAAGLQHPGILGLIDSGEYQSVLFYVMPYVDGNTLRMRLQRDGELPVDEALRLLREIAEALAYAHGQGVLHRDIKPENVLFMAGHALLADFGLAKAVAPAAHGDPPTTTAVGTALGSPAYMAPETLVADGSADHRADLYAFGVLAYEVLAGQHPFSGVSAGQLAAAHLTRAAPPLRSLRPALPAGLEALVARCLEKRPADRVQSAADLCRRLGEISAEMTGPSGALRENEVTRWHFKLTESLCRRLDRASFSPRMIGDSMEMLDNGVRSDVLVCFIHAVGLDGSDFEAHLRDLPYRAVAPTLYGYEATRRRRVALPLDDHILLLREVLRDLVERSAASTVLVVGFSSGADVALRLVGAAGGSPHIDGVLTLGCNLGLETCFLTRILARLRSGKALVEDLRAIGDGLDTLDEWLSLHAYVVRMLHKFRLEVGPLRDFARDVVRPFETDENAFAAMARSALHAGAELRCLFEDTETCNRLLREVQLRNLDAGVLGDRYREGSLLIEPETTHFDLLQPERVRRHLESMVSVLGDVASRTTTSAMDSEG